MTRPVQAANEDREEDDESVSENHGETYLVSRTTIRGLAMSLSISKRGATIKVVWGFDFYE